MCTRLKGASYLPGLAHPRDLVRLFRNEMAEVQFDGNQGPIAVMFHLRTDVPDQPDLSNGNSFIFKGFAV